MEKKINVHDSNVHAQAVTEIILTNNLKTINPQLIKIFEDELKDIYWSEKALAKSIAKILKQASSRVLIETLKAHLEEKREQVKRIENAFELIQKDPAEKKCKAVANIIEETEQMMHTFDEGVARDSAIVSGSQQVEHYEIGIYKTLCKFAENLGLKDIASILQKTLTEEIAANKRLSEITGHI
jgi:ferritin-like metal-binding protein YciE